MNLAPRNSSLFWVLITFALLGPRFLQGSSWPQFRGPTGQGLAEADRLPLAWSEDKNVSWKTAIHGRAWSSPVAAEKRIWLSSANEKGTELFALCVDADSGRIIHDLKLFDVATPQYAHPFNTYASPSPVLE